MDDNLAKLIAETTNKAYSQGVDHAMKTVEKYLDTYELMNMQLPPNMREALIKELEELKRNNEG